MKHTSIATVLAAATTASALATRASPSEFRYAGCYSDNVAARVLLNYTDVPGGRDTMTIKSCLATCKQNGYVLAGLEYASECFCDSYIQNNHTSIPEEKCNMKCNGNNTEICGGAAALSLYTLGDNVPTPAPIVNSKPKLREGWYPEGCYTDSVGARALTGAIIPAPKEGMTIEYCVEKCDRAAYRLAGVEYGGECYCGKDIQNGHGPSPATADCNMRCSGNSGQKCGGPGRMNVYNKGYLLTPAIQKSGVNYYGCRYELSDTVRETGMVAGNASAGACVAFCAGSGASYAGLWWGNSCTCGNKVGDVDAFDSQCNLSCPGDEQWSCGSTSGKVLVYSLTA